MNRVFVLGLDCLTPQLLFDSYRDELPTFRRLMEQGAWGRLRSSDPPITVPAWACMFSGRDPGELGLYGFRNRADHSYDNLALADSRAVRAPRAWEIASEAGQDVVVLGVPQTFPPTAVRGVLVSSFLAPSKDANYTYPALVKWELDRLAGDDERGYVIDVEDFRTEDKARLLRDIHGMTRRRFRVARAWIDQRKWDLFCMVEMGPDRLHHGFWRYADPGHRLYEAGNPWEHAILDYYRLLDEELERLLAALPPDASMIIVSDHGARRMEGGICVNEWLIEQGLLKVKRYPEAVERLEPDNVVWSETRVWAEGGYYGRVFINVQGREPEGLVPAAEYETFRTELARQITAIRGPDGEELGTVVHRPEELYREVNNVAPDLMVYFGDLAWRSVGTLGHRATHTLSNDSGPDDANHDYHGVFLARDKQLGATGELEGLTLYDVLPTILDRLGLPVPDDLVGSVLTGG
jgi:predicted AlkP superfamily phosphohydrolase/phosphomutase